MVINLYFGHVTHVIINKLHTNKITTAQGHTKKVINA